MSVTTESDRLKEQAVEYLVKARKAMTALVEGVIHEKVWGHDEYSQEFKDRIVADQRAIEDILAKYVRD